MREDGEPRRGPFWGAVEAEGHYPACGTLKPMAFGVMLESPWAGQPPLCQVVAHRAVFACSNSGLVRGQASAAPFWLMRLSPDARF